MRCIYKNSLEKQINNLEPTPQQSKKHIRLGPKSIMKRSKSPKFFINPLSKLLSQKEKKEKEEENNDKNNEKNYNTDQTKTTDISSPNNPNSKKVLTFIPKFIRNASNSEYYNTDKNIPNSYYYHKFNKSKVIQNKEKTFTNISEIEIDLAKNVSSINNTNNNVTKNYPLKKQRIPSFGNYRKKMPVNTTMNSSNKNESHIIKINKNDKNKEQILNSEKTTAKKINIFMLSKEQAMRKQYIKKENNNIENKSTIIKENKNKLDDKDDKNLYEINKKEETKCKVKIIDLNQKINSNKNNNNNENNNNENNNNDNNINNNKNNNSNFYIKKNKIPSHKNKSNNNIHNLNNIILNENREIEKTRTSERTNLQSKRQLKTFKFLIHEASKDRELSNSFHKYYGKKNPRLSGSSEECLLNKLSNKTENSINEINTGKLRNTVDKKNICLINSPKPINNTINILNDSRKNINNNSNEINYNIKTINLSKFIKVDKDLQFVDKKKNNVLKIIKTPLTTNKKDENQTDDFVIKNYKTQKNYTPIITQYSTEIIIDVDLFIFFGEKISIIINKINNYQLCEKECQSYLSLYFEKKFHDSEINLFLNLYNKQEIMLYLKLELLCFFLLIDISINNSFTQASILLRTIFNLIYFNYMILLNLILELYFSNQVLIKGDIKRLKNIIGNFNKNEKIYDENEVILKITQSYHSLSTYYKILVESLYFPYNIIKEDENRFPHCIKRNNNKNNKYNLINILASFFIDGFISLEEYDYNDLKIFFELYFNNNKIRKNSNFNNNSGIICFLPKIKSFNQFTLVLDLDETLISMKKNNFELSENNNTLKNLIKTNLIYRPGLIDFLRSMKQIYELIIFSSGSIDYVKGVVNHIEKEEKFFDYVLYRKYMSFDESGHSFKNLNCLNRNLKNIIIVDDMAKNFKLHKRNGICIKPFKGDVISDKNTLFILGQILQKIRCDVSNNGDIRDSLSKEKNTNIYSQIANE